ncbi:MULTISPECIES: hypothetical protein [Bartonella]|uniref:hypothetical protein n=1 Tax=Bartonella TaxID=773 RepID=UPI0018DDAFF9|nr:hypothetical protein [Bartonella choladocola]MBI0140271.1 hypothetical protein [Bartonella choladocola]
MVVIFGNSSSKCQLFSNRSNIISQQSDAHSGIVYLVLLLLGGGANKGATRIDFG